VRGISVSGDESGRLIEQRVCLKQLQEPIGKKWQRCGEVRPRAPKGLKRFAIAFRTMQERSPVKRTVYKVAIVDLDDFVASLAEMNVDVLQRAEKPEVRYFGTQLFQNLSHHGALAGFPELNSAAQGPTVALALDLIMCLVHKDTSAKAENAKRKRSDSLQRHVPVT
jgi:hypothetical protein